MRAIGARLAAAAIVLPLVLIGQALLTGPAQAGKEGVGAGNYVFVPPAAVPGTTSTSPASGAGGTVSTDTTQRTVSDINAAIAFCSALSQDAYTVDCLSDQFEKVARTLPKTGDYADARQALMTAASKLHALSGQYYDRKMGRGYARSSGAGGASSTRPLTPVRPEALPEVKRKAAAIVAEAQTVLLRSAESSQRRKAHYEQIAAAVGSANKVLLRSA